MKNLSIRSAIFTILSIFIIVVSCSKGYYEDGGVHSPTYDGTIMQFLKSRPELFDTLVKVINYTKYTSLLDDPKAKVTFFAATNQSIAKSMTSLNRVLYNKGQDTVLDVKQVSPEVWEKFIALYIYNDKSLLKDYPQLDTNNLLVYPGQGYLSIAGEPMNIGSFYNDVTSSNSDGILQVIKYAGYRQLIVSYSNPVATSDIQPANGVIHVLQFLKHSFGFSAADFSANAINKGISY